MASEPPEATDEKVSEEPPIGGLRGALVAFESRNFRILFAGRVTSNMARTLRVFVCTKNPADRMTFKGLARELGNTRGPKRLPCRGNWRREWPR